MNSSLTAATRLEIDESIIHSQLKIKSDNDEFDDLLNAALSEREKQKERHSELPYKTVKPKPGFCVKTKNIITSQKVFINVCHTDVIPAPVDISESELTCILESDEPSTFRIPLSLGEGHDELDKSKQPCLAFDVAINSTFFLKVEESLLFQTFLITLVCEGLEDKYNTELDKNGWNILKNKKCFGTIQNHRIEQRHETPYVQEVPNKLQLTGEKQKLVEEVDPSKLVLSKQQVELQDPKYSLVRTREGVKLLLARIPVRESVDQLSLSTVTQDSLVLRGRDGHSIVNVTFPYSVDSQRSKAIFNKTSKILTVLLPLV